MSVASVEQAYTKLDPKLVGDLIADDYVPPVREGGCCFTDRQAAIQAVINHRDNKIPHPITSMTSDQTVVRIYGKIAIVTGIETINMSLTTADTSKAGQREGTLHGHMGAASRQMDAHRRLAQHTFDNTVTINIY